MFCHVLLKYITVTLIHVYISPDGAPFSAEKYLYFSYFTTKTYVVELASVAQLDARPTGDQEVAGSNPAKVGNILSWRLIMKYFLLSFSPFC